MTIVVLDHVATCRGTGDNGSPAPGDEDTRAHGRATGVLKDNVGVSADQLAYVFAESAPLALVLGVLVLPEAVVHRLAVDHVLTSHFAQSLGPRLVRDDSH